MMNGNELNRFSPTTKEEASELSQTVSDMFEYHKPTEEQVNSMAFVRTALQSAAMIIFQCVPPSADRATALRKIREARMDANSAIIHEGKY